MSELMHNALNNIDDLHTLIEDVFTGRHGDKSLISLLASFDENFKMVTTQGNCIGKNEVIELFKNNHGKKTSFHTRCIDKIPLYENNGYCWIQYKEEQKTHGIKTARISTVCIRVEDEKCYWFYLHETLAETYLS